MNTLWLDLAARAGMTLTDSQSGSLDRYLDLLFQANERMNLTRISDRTQAEIHHVGDAMTLLPFIGPGSVSIADVGSGGGVPGIPLAIVHPDARMILIESTKKKAAFLSEAVRELDLKNVSVVPLRAEEAARAEERESFDVVVSRAVGQLVWLAEWCLPLAKMGGKVLAMKGSKVQEEIPAASKAIKLLGGGEPIIHSVQLPGTEHHVIVEIPKVTKTDAKYPRNPTMTRGKPIG